MNGSGPDQDARIRTSVLLRDRRAALASDVATAISTLGGGLSREQWTACAELLIRLFAAGADEGTVDPKSAYVRELARYSPPLTTRHLHDALGLAERVVLDELVHDDRRDAPAEGWAAAARSLRRTTLEIAAAQAEQAAAREAPIQTRDPLTTLIAGPVFELALAQEVERAVRQKHALALLLFDIDDLSGINREHGWGVGDRLLERTGILARRYFRRHDWVARHDKDAIAVLLPETTLDQAARLAARFQEMVQQRLVLVDHKTDASRVVTVSAAAVGTDLVQEEIEAGAVMAEARSAVVRARQHGAGRVERVALLPASVTIFGAAAILGRNPREVARLIRNGTLPAARRGRHLHIDRERLDRYRTAKG